MKQTTHQESIVKVPFVSDEFRINGTLHLPEASRPPVIIGVHGLASDGDSPKQIALAERCNALGMAFLRFDHRGCGKSEGRFETVTSLAGRRRDLLCAVSALRSRGDLGQGIGFFGSSMGGTVSLSVAGDHPVDAVVVVAAPVTGRSVVRLPERGDGSALLTPEFYREHLDFDISDKLTSIRGILVFHGDRDEVVPVSSGKEIFARASDPKKLIVQENGDHRISDPEHQKQFIAEASDWFASLLL